ncbi:MAG: hypothetical protein AB1486_20765 [Planctomycetota bacterium]
MQALRTPWVIGAVLFSVQFSGPVRASAAPQETVDPAQAEGVASPARDSPEGGAVQYEAIQSSVLEALGRLPAAFIENRGQLDDRVAFSARKGGLRAYFTKNAILLELVPQRPAPHLPLSPKVARQPGNNIRGAHVFLTFEGASPDVVIEGCERLPGRYNYLLGSDPSKWRTDVPGFASIRYRGLYPGVDMVVRDGGGRLEYDLILEPAADIDAITVRCEGGQSLRLGEGGALILETAAGPLQQCRPCTYELGPDGTRQAVECSYRLLGVDRFGFDVPGRDRDRALVIDPGLTYGTFLGGSSQDSGLSIALDASGEALLTGYTWSPDFPTTPGAYDTSCNGGYYDAFVAKLGADGSTLLYATFLGGADVDWGLAIAVDASGAAVVTGATKSSDFPTTPGACDTSHNGSLDLFVAKLSADGSNLLYATFLGGSGDEEGQAIALDAAGAAVVAGTTGSADFPTTPGAYNTSFNGDPYDAFLAKLSADGSMLLYATFLGGWETDEGEGVALDASGAALLTGYTASRNFPTTPGAYDTSFNGDPYDAFVAKLDAGGSTLLYGTYLGGSDADEGAGVALDGSSAAVVVGETFSADFPTTQEAFDRTYNRHGDAFVAKLSEDGSTLLYGTFLGGTSQDRGHAIAFDASGAAAVTGFTWSSDFPTTQGAYDASFNGEGDAFVVKLHPNGSNLLYGTFLGGASQDRARAIALDASGGALVLGHTESPDFPTTPGAYDTSYNSGLDAFVVKLVPSVCEADAAWWNYSLGWPGTHGVPCFISNGVPVVCAPLSLILCNSSGANTTGYLFIGLSPADLPTPWDGHLLVGPEWVCTLALPSGPTSTLEGEVPCDPALCGLHLYLQVLELDPGASRGVSFTAGLELVFGS